MQVHGKRTIAAAAFLLPVGFAHAAGSGHIGLGYAKGTTETVGGGEVEDTKAYLTAGVLQVDHFAKGASMRLGPAFGDGAINDVFLEVRGRAGLRTQPGGFFGYGLLSARLTQWDFPVLYGGGVSLPLNDGPTHPRLYAEYVVSGGAARGGVTGLAINNYTEWSAGVRWRFGN